ncbi:MAG TPA: hypothetical protein VH915_05390 [Pedococcus sp.]
MNATSHRHDVRPEPGEIPARQGRAPASPDALRAPRPTWRDPRLWVGVAIVAVCVLVGARLLAGADDTVRVWAAAERLPAGTTVGAGALQPQEVRFASSELADRYLSAEQAPPQGVTLEREVLAGELLPRAALGAGTGAELVEVPVAVGAHAVPADLRVGDVVDVWVAPHSAALTPDSGAEPRAQRVLEQVRVVAAPRGGSALGPATTRQVVIGVPASEEGVLPTALAELSAGHPVLVRRG